MTRAQALLAQAVCLTAPAAAAQEPAPIVTTAPASAARWDVSGHIAWLGERRPADGIVQWDRWFGVASFGASAGYYWTPHLKTELDVSTSNEGGDYTFVQIAVPGQTAPLFVERDHETRFTTASAGLTGQFFENVWFHPFVSAGLEIVREREHIETIPPPVPPRGPVLIPGPRPKHAFDTQGGRTPASGSRPTSRNVRSSAPTSGRRGRVMVLPHWAGAAASVWTSERVVLFTVHGVAAQTAPDVWKQFVERVDVGTGLNVQLNDGRRIGHSAGKAVAIGVATGRRLLRHHGADRRCHRRLSGPSQRSNSAPKYCRSGTS